jgi:hypothetical protein
MKNHRFIPSFVLAAAVAASLAVATTARADDPLPEPAEAPVAGQGLLGQVYGTLTYSYINFDGVSAHADDYHFAINQPISYGLDGFISYDFVQTGLIAGDRASQNIIMLGVRPFSTRFNWGKPYAEAAAGYAWGRYAGNSDDSFIWEVAVGAEFQVSTALSVTPYVQYVDAPELASEGSWNFGVKGNYWVKPQWALTAGVEVDDEQNAAFTVGTNFRF